MPQNPPKKPSLFLRREWLELLLLALPFIVAAIFWSRFPDRVATHWNIHGHADGWMPKNWGLMLLPVINIGIWLLFFCLPWLDPKIRKDRANYDQTVAVLRTWRLAMVLFFCFISLLILGVAGGFPIDMDRALVNGVLILFAVLGKYLGRLQPNYVAGIRTPWTLDDPEIWKATHRQGGRIMTYGALLLLVVQFFLSEEALMKMFLVYAIGFALWSIAYSYYLFRRKIGKA
jgi:uncharacterized membrane protein